MTLIDIVSDVSGTMCKEEIPKEWVLYHVKLSSFLQKIKLLGKAAVNYIRWLQSKDPSHFYDTLQDLPFGYSEFVYDLTPNPHWDDIIREKQPKRVGIITQDDLFIVAIYLSTQKQRFKDLGIEVKVLRTNQAKHKNGFYTGEAELNVTKNTLPSLLFKYSSAKYILGDNNINSIIKDYPDLIKKFINLK